MAENTTKTKTTKTYTENEVKNLIDSAVKNALKEYAAANAQKEIIVKSKNDEEVTLLYLGSIAKGTAVELGDRIGSINKSGGTRTISKRDFIQLRTPIMDDLLESRNLIVIDGLTDDERERYGVKYEEGELLTEDTYRRLLNFDRKHIIEIFKKLCPQHKRIVATMFIDAFEANDNRVNFETVNELNKISKEIDKDGLLTPIVVELQKRQL